MGVIDLWMDRRVTLESWWSITFITSGIAQFWATAKRVKTIGESSITSDLWHGKWTSLRFMPIKTETHPTQGLPSLLHKTISYYIMTISPFKNGIAQVNSRTPTIHLQLWTPFDAKQTIIPESSSIRQRFGDMAFFSLGSTLVVIFRDVPLQI